LYNKIYKVDFTENGKYSDDLPEWDLTDLYTNTDCSEISRDLTWLKNECKMFANEFEGKLAELNAIEFLACLRRSEKISNISGRLISYAGLRYYQATTDGERTKFLSDIQEKITIYTSSLIFFNLELNRLPNSHLDGLYSKNEDLHRYKPVLDKIRALQPYQLSDELEKFLHEMGIVGDAWEKLFDETIAGLEFSLDDQILNLESTLNLLTDHDRSKRKAGAQELANVFSKNLKIFARIHNTQAKEKEIIDQWRGMPTPQFGRHLSNDVEPEVVEALRNAVVASYPDLSHRYYELKRNWMGLDHLEIWDRNAPLPMESNQTIAWSDAQKLVLDAYSGFDPRMEELAKPFFSKGWIDAAVKPGKAPGAFAHPTVTNVHPYIMLLSSTPLTLAETASVFGEMLTFRKMLEKASEPHLRKVLLANKVEDMINTVVRQIAFYDFECKLHDARKKGELTPEDINALWMSIQADSLGPAFKFMDGYETFWAYIPHFVHSPFYVYAYAFGDGLVNALYAEYEERPDGFSSKYFEMLEAGGSKHHSDLLAPFNLNASDPKFWSKGLSVISSMIDELEMLN